MLDDNRSDRPEPSTSPNPWLAYAASVAGSGHWPPIAVTFFRDKFASSKQCEDLTLPDLRERIAKATAKTKARLPLLKLATFGNQRTKKNSLRHNANVIEITGTEAEYD